MFITGWELQAVITANSHAYLATRWNGPFELCGIDFIDSIGSGQPYWDPNGAIQFDGAWDCVGGRRTLAQTSQPAFVRL